MYIPAAVRVLDNLPPPVHGSARSSICSSMTLPMRGMGLLSLALLTACSSEPSAPQSVRIVSTWVTEQVASQVNSSGRFIGQPRSHRYVPRVSAESVAIAVARSMVQGAAFEAAGRIIERDRGSSVDFANLGLCGNTEYVEVATDDLPPQASGPARRAYGPTWGVTLCARGNSAAQVSIGVPDGPRDFRIENNALVLESFRKFGGGANWTTSAVGPTYPTGITVSAEAAVEAVFRMIGRRINSVPRAFKLMDERDPRGIPTPSCAAWRVSVELPVRVRGLESGVERDVQEFFVERLGRCLDGPIAVFAPSPTQPAGRSIPERRDTTGMTENVEFYTIVVPVHGLGHFERVELVR
jgi:hypothetical protein